jgi:L-rhamnose mutarotase
MSASELETYAFRMQLHPGRRDAYRARHDAIPAELVALLREAGVRDYSIFLDPETDALFAILKRPKSHGMADLPSHPAMQRWWAAMADIMDTHPSNEPVCVPLVPLFHMD